MKRIVLSTFALIATAILHFPALSQSSMKIHREPPTESYNPWELDFAAGGAFPFGSSKRELFRTKGLSGKITARHFWDHVGLGLSSGFITGKINNASVNQFMKERGLSPDEMNIGTGDPNNAFLLLGPSFRFGNKVNFNVDVQGGLFLNNAGSVDIAAKGSDRSLYRFGNGNKNMAPGFSGGLNINYPISRSIRFFVTTSYLQAKIPVSMLDLKNGMDVATQIKRDMKVLTAGVGISVSLGPDVYQRKHIGGVKYKNRISSVPHEGNCGPVTLTTSRPGGIVQQLTFSCPQDAVVYTQGDAMNTMRTINQNNSMPSRLSMTPTTARQTQGKTFGEKIGAGLQSAGFISGNISWQSSPLPQIITNETAIAPSGNNDEKIKDKSHEGQIIHATFSLNNEKNGEDPCKGCGLTITSVTGTPVRNETVNPIYSSGGEGSNPLYEKSAVTQNPLYQGDGHTVSNPLFNGNKISTGNGEVCGQTAHLLVLLIDGNGREIAQTNSDSCGNFWFANVPAGVYMVAVSGNVTATKNYEVSINKDGANDLTGMLSAGNAELVLTLNSQETDSTVMMQKVIVRGWDPKDKKDITANANQVSQRVAGNPIDGIIVKGGKNPGGDFKTIKTDSDGRFTLSNLAKGNYTITAEVPYIINESAIVHVGVEHWGDPHENLNGKSEHGDFNSSRSNKETRHELVQSGLTNTIGQVIFSISKDGMLNGKLEAQDYNSTRSNKSYLVIHEDGTISGTCNAQDFNTVRSNRQNPPKLKNNSTSKQGSVISFAVNDDGTVTGKLEAQDYKFIRSNQSYLVIHEDGTISGTCNAQDFNTVRSNRSGVDPSKKS